MSDELIISLEYQQTLLALIVQAGSSLESSGSVVVQSWCRIYRRLVLIHLSGFLPSVLEPNNDDSRAKVQQFGQVFEIIVFRVCIVFEEFLKYLYLVICKSGSVSPFATGAGSPVSVVTQQSVTITIS